MASVEELELKVAKLERESAKKEAEIRKLVAQQGGVEEASKGDEELAKKLSELKVGEKLTSEVPLELLMAFFEESVKGLKDEELSKELDTLLEDLPFDSAVRQERTLRLRERLDKLYMSIWNRYGVDEGAATKAVSNAGFTAASDDLTEEEQEELSSLIDDFQEAEQMLMGVKVLGKEEFESRVAQRDRFMNIQEELMDELNDIGGDQMRLRDFIMKIQAEGFQVQKKLQEMGPEAASQYVENPSPEDELVMMRMQAMQMLLEGGGGHGHSHNGEPCHGHGGAHSHQSHGHSHNGEPCHGHGGAHSHQSHGHSHNGEPCHGHGHHEA